MKKNLVYSTTLILSLLVVGSCKKELDVNPQERIPIEDFYKNESDAFTALVAVYDRFGFQSNLLYDKASIMDVAGDDQTAGGGSSSDINDLQVTQRYTLTSTTGPQTYLWTKGYTGIYRANVLLQKLPGIPMADATRVRFTAECKAMRAAFYFDLVTFFKHIPIIEGTISIDSLYNVTQVPPADVYAYVEKDLNEAIADLPQTVPVATEGGRFTKGGAKALLGKVLLYEKKWQQAADQFADVNGPTPGAAASSYGYKLLPNFADLWITGNKFNTESVLEFGHSSKSNGGWADAGATEGNLLCITTGPRSYARKDQNAPDFYPGYGFLVFSKDFAETIMKNDPRYDATISDVGGMAAAGKVTYQESFDNKGYGYFLKKFIGLNANKVNTTPELNFGQDEYEIRLADTYLMEAEALMNAGAGVGPGTRAYQLLNAVRARVGLAATDVTQDNLEFERRMELAGEGLRWPDLVRWGKAAATLQFKGFKAGKNEIFPIPQTELDNTKLQQSKEWGGPL